MVGYLHHRCCCALNYKLNMKVLLFSFIFISFLLLFFFFCFCLTRINYAMLKMCSTRFSSFFAFKKVESIILICFINVFLLNEDQL